MPDLDMLINHVHGEESRVAIVEGGKLEELYTERVSSDLHVGNIYRGKVINIEASIQAAFIDFGEARAGFLHITDLHPRYFPGDSREETEKVGEKTPRRDRPPIQRALRRGQEILVQVLKEGLGTKGPTLTSYLSIPGRYLVMMPNMERHGVSRKVEDPEKRREMRRILDDLNPPEEFGFIVRTAGIGRNKTELKRDLNYLLRLWKNIEVKMKSGRGPALLYTESDLVIRTLRDVLTADVKRIIIDDRAAALRAREFLRIATPRSSIKVIHYSSTAPLFDAFDVERQIQIISQRIVPMANGGSLVFDQAEALVAIDVNSGKFRDSSDAEENAYRANLDAVDEIARQLRLRDLGGIIVLDLIDMYIHRHRREVERRFKEAIKRDRARTKLVRISELGLMEMTRQRMRPSLRKSVYNECPTCHGVGHVLSPQSVMLEVMRRLAVVLNAEKAARVELTAHPEVLAQLLNRKRMALVDLENRSGKKIEFRFNTEFAPDQIELAGFDAKESRVEPDSLPRMTKPKFTDADEIGTDDLAELDDLLEDEGELLEEEAAEVAQAEDDEGGDEARPAVPVRRQPPVEVKKQAPRQERGERGERQERQEPLDRGAGGEAASGGEAEGGGEGEGDGEGEGGVKKRRRRRRRRRGGAAGGGGERQDQQGGPMAEGDEPMMPPQDAGPERDQERGSDQDPGRGEDQDQDQGQGRGRGRRGRGRGRGRGREPVAPPESAVEAIEASRESAELVLEHDAAEPHAFAGEGFAEGDGENEERDGLGQGAGGEAASGEDRDGEGGVKKRRRRRGGRRHRRRTPAPGTPGTPDSSEGSEGGASGGGENPGNERGDAAPAEPTEPPERPEASERPAKPSVSRGYERG